jgi:hypothetical protein
MKKAATGAITSPRAAAFVNSLAVVFLFAHRKTRPEEEENPGACSDIYMLTYCLRHWFTRYGIASGLPIVLRYKRPESLPGMLVAGLVLLAVRMPVVNAGLLL